MAFDLDEKPQILSLDGEEAPQLETWAELVAGANPMTTNADLYVRQLEEAQPRLFCSPDKMKFDILDILGRLAWE